MFAFFIEIEKYYMCYLSYVEDFQKILSWMAHKFLWRSLATALFKLENIFFPFPFTYPLKNFAFAYFCKFHPNMTKFLRCLEEPNKQESLNRRRHTHYI